LDFIVCLATFFKRVVSFLIFVLLASVFNMKC
jgi:hypothetical protein